MSGSLWGDKIPLYEISVGTSLYYTLPPHVFLRWREYAGTASKWTENPYSFAASGARIYAEPIAFGIDPVYDRSGQLRIVGSEARLSSPLTADLQRAAAPLIAHLIDLRAQMDRAFGEPTLVWLHLPEGEFGIQFDDDLMLHGGHAYRIRVASGRYEVPLGEREQRFMKMAPQIERDLRAAVARSFGTPRNGRRR